MSLGQILGGIVGGIVGFFTGGPYGALYGILIGAGIGGYIDPNTPDLPTPGAPDPQIQSMSGKIGVGVPDLCGSAKITGHLLAYGNEHHIEITETQESGGKGGGSSSTTYVTGYTYYMTWAVGICTGPVNTLYTIFKNEDVVWEGELNLDDAVNGEETITLDGMGSCTFYFGTDDHVQNSVLEDIIPNPDYNTPYRNFCYAVLDDCIIGEYPRTPTLKFLIRKIPEYSFSDFGEIQTYDCNPMNIIWYLLYEVIGVPESWLDTTVFGEVANVLNREHRGLSILLDKQQDALVYLQTVNFHIDNILSYSNEGKFYPKLFRDDYDVDAAPIVDADVIVDNPVFNRKSWNDTINEVKVQYTQLTALRPVEWVIDDNIVYLNVIDMAWTDTLGGIYGRFVAVGLYGTSHYSDDGGYTWTAVPFPVYDTYNCTQIEYQNGLFFAKGTNCFTSVDGESWTTLDIGGTAYNGCVAWNAEYERWVLIVSIGTPEYIRISEDDGDTWITKSGAGNYSSHWGSMEFGANHYTFVTSGPGFMSEDTDTWGSYNTSNLGTIGGLGVRVRQAAANHPNPTIMVCANCYTLDAITWIRMTTPEAIAPPVMQNFDYSPSFGFMGSWSGLSGDPDFGYSGTMISTDGINWVNQEMPATAVTHYGCCCGGDRWIQTRRSDGLVIGRMK